MSITTAKRSLITNLFNVCCFPYLPPWQPTWWRRVWARMWGAGRKYGCCMTWRRKGILSSPGRCKGIAGVTRNKKGPSKNRAAVNIYVSFKQPSFPGLANIGKTRLLLPFRNINH